MHIDEFVGKTPVFRFEKFFLGRTRAWGVFEDRFGRLRREMSIDMTGAQDDDGFILDEAFDFADGERLNRRWRTTILPGGRYAATADDVIGPALGEAAGNAVHWRYRTRLKMNGRDWIVDFDDWMFLQRDGGAVNRSWVRWKGLLVGSVSMFIQRRD